MASPQLGTYTAPSPQFELEETDDKRQRVFKESMSKIKKHPKSSTSNVSLKFNFNLTILSSNRLNLRAERFNQPRRRAS